MKQYQYLFLFSILVLSLSLPIILNVKNPIELLEGFSNYTLADTTGLYPCSQKIVLVQDTYPAIGKNKLSNNSSEDIWKDYPVFKVGSFDPITNNIRYPDNPDNGICAPASMCGALYKDKVIGENYIHPLPPVEIGGRRVGYFNTDKDLLTYNTDIANILY